MKIIKYIFTIFLLLCSAFFVFIATQKNDYKITRQKEINVEKENLYNYINDFSTWKDWFDLKDFDKSVKQTFTVKTSEKNPSLTWKSSTINGKITTIKTIPSDTIYQNILIGDDIHKITWCFTSNNKTTKVNWSMEGKSSFKWKLNNFLKSGIDDIYGGLFESGLSQIEQNLIAELSSFKITQNGIVSKNTSYFIQQKDSCKIDNFLKNYQEIVESTKQFAKTNNFKTINLPFVIINERNNIDNYIIYSVCIATENEILISDENKITSGYFDDYIAYKTTLTGNYIHLESARKKTEKSILESDYVIDTNRNYIEIYKISLTETKNESKWVTEIYYPIKKKYVKPIEIINTDPIKDSTKVLVAQPVE
jgi:hypothetical protein